MQVEALNGKDRIWTYRSRTDLFNFVVFFQAIELGTGNRLPIVLWYKGWTLITDFKFSRNFVLWNQKTGHGIPFRTVLLKLYSYKSNYLRICKNEHSDWGLGPTFWDWISAFQKAPRWGWWCCHELHFSSKDLG